MAEMAPMGTYHIYVCNGLFDSIKKTRAHTIEIVFRSEIKINFCKNVQVYLLG